MRDIEGAHLGAAPAAGRGHGETHLVVDIHERQRAGGVGTGAGNVGAAWTQRREFIADAATGLERQPGFVDLAQDVIHRVGDDARHGAVDRAGGRLVLERASVGGDATSGNGAATQCPQEAFVPISLLLGRGLGISQGPGDALVGIVDGGIDGIALLGLETVFLVPDVLGRRLQCNALRGTFPVSHRRYHRLQANRTHRPYYLPCCKPEAAHIVFFGDFRSTAND